MFSYAALSHGEETMNFNEVIQLKKFHSPLIGYLKTTVFISALAFLLISVLPYPSWSNEQAKVHFEKGLEFNKKGEYTKSREELIKAVQLDIGTHQFHQGLFFHFIQTRSGPKGIVFYQDLKKQFPKSATVAYWLGRFFLQKKSYQDAAREFKEATRLAPRDDHAFIALGHTYWEMEKADEAFKAYNQANQLSPNVAVVHEGLGNVHYKRKDFDKAQKAYAKAIKLEPTLIVARFNLGLIYEENKEFEKAFDQWTEILKIDPNETQARERLAWIYFMGEEFSEAAREFSTILKIRPSSPNIYMGLGESLILLSSSFSDPEQVAQIRNSAIEAFQHTVDLDPDNSRAREYLSKLKGENKPTK